MKRRKKKTNILLHTHEPTDVHIEQFGTCLKPMKVLWKQRQINSFWDHNATEASSCGLAPGHFIRKWVWGPCDMWMLWNARWMEGSIIKIMTDGCGRQQHSLPRVIHYIVRSFNTTSFTRFNQWPSRHLIWNFLQYCCVDGSTREEEEPLVTMVAVFYLSPGTAVAPGCRQVGVWVVCVVSVSHLYLCWQVGFGILHHTFASPWVHVSVFEMACLSWEKRLF